MKPIEKIKMSELSCRSLADMHGHEELRYIANALAEAYNEITESHSSDLSKSPCGQTQTGPKPSRE